jgi:hypothetical protein
VTPDSSTGWKAAMAVLQVSAIVVGIMLGIMFFTAITT